MPEINSFFEDVKHSVFEKPIKKNDDVQVKSSLDNINDFLLNGSTINQKYHDTEIKQAQVIIKWAMIIFSVVTAALIVMIFYILLKKDDHVAKELIPVISATVIDLMTIVIMKIMQSFINSKNDYFKQSAKAEEQTKVICLIRTVEDSDKRNEMIGKIIENYCQNNK